MSPPLEAANQDLVDELQAKRRQARQQVLKADLDLYPPEADPDSIQEPTTVSQ